MRVVVGAQEGGNEEVARELAERLGLELVPDDEAPAEALVLACTRSGLLLRETGPRAAGPLRVAFRSGRGPALLSRATLAGRREVETIIDATAGLGADAFAMAEAGARVDLIERSPVVAALLADGLERATRDPALAPTARRMTLHVGEASRLLPRLAPAHVVHLDPMYPTSGREGGKAKEMRILRRLLGDDLDAPELLALARSSATKRVVVKRPLKAPPLAGEEPSGSLRGKTVRYDLYAPAAKSSTGAQRD
ncbi:MAG TPA: class I SAM-dependent methyltransferase [Trueperaceae bacterium]